MDSLAQLHAYPPPPPAETRRRFDSAARLQGLQGLQEHAQWPKGTRYARSTTSSKLEIGQAYGDPTPPREIDLERRDRLGRLTRLRKPVTRPQHTVAVPGASNEADAPRPHGILEAFVKTCQRWRLDRNQQVVLLGFSPPSTLGTYVLNGQVLSASVDVQDRAALVFGISLGLGALFDEDPGVENEWLRTPRARFANASPLDYMLEGHMNHLLAVAELVRHERGL